MGLFKKKPDPITDRAQALNAEIAALENKIKKLNTQVESSTNAGVRLRSTALPGGTTIPGKLETAPSQSEAPIFEDVGRPPLTAAAESPTTAQHFNEMGVRKYDLMALIARVKKKWQGPSLANPQLVNYLAAGSVQGLKPLRYEKRVARNRFLFFTAILAFVLLSILVYVLGRHF